MFTRIESAVISSSPLVIIPPLIEWGLYCNHLVRPSVFPFVRPSVCLSVHPFVCPSIRLSVRPSVCLSVHLSVRPFVRPSVHTFVTDISASTGRNDFIFDIPVHIQYTYIVGKYKIYLYEL